ncbi:uncharacterized protein LOC130808541 [Amaranthus tricolor]|uniref:uncharacterized protein LOC130808541 n=1 Tax=Amaranthus tricolor TaxID=29722 RepID=UPI00258C9302|nr:uncharacterized protein LOC130808541 [Amaranthus tricolor]
MRLKALERDCENVRFFVRFLSKADYDVDYSYFSFHAMIKGMQHLHCRVHLVDSHILPDDSCKALVSKDSEWQCLDDIVRTWIYGSISPSLLQFIVRPDDCAFDAWTRLENKFQNNKTSCILHLESQFNDISLSTFTM